MPELPPAPTESLNTPGLSPQQRARLLQRLRRGLAALSIVGAALVALPLAQLMRYQSAEIQSLAAKRASLDPIARAVSLQRGLLAHGELANLVLRGQDKLEADRRTRQAEVDGRMAALNVALASGHWDLAMSEADELRNDWLQLARQVQERQIAATDSHATHRLLVEQTLQVIDLVSAARNGQADGRAHAEAATAVDDLPAGTMTAIRALPRLVWMTAELQSEESQAQGPAAPQRAAALQAALARTLNSIQRSSRREGRQDPTDPFTGAAAEAASTSALYFDLRRSQPAGSAERQGAARAALQAQMRLFDLAYGQASSALAAQARDVSQKRALLLGGLCFGVLVALGLVIGLRRDLRHLAADEQLRADAQAAAPGIDGQTGRRLQADRLLQRLREGQSASAVQSLPAPRSHTEFDCTRN